MDNKIILEYKNFKLIEYYIASSKGWPEPRYKLVKSGMCIHIFDNYNNAMQAFFAWKRLLIIQMDSKSIEEGLVQMG